jgi:hypothetical protein
MTAATWKYDINFRMEEQNKQLIDCSLKDEAMIFLRKDALKNERET